ncbi:MAG: DUF302 domain-containing protein [Steroidobacteraceae bacterium]
MDGVVTVDSHFGPTETTRRLIAAIGARGLTVFARVDHAAGAAAAGLELRPTELIVFGSARGGTPLMQANQLLGIELPLKALVWADEAGRAHVSRPDLTWLAHRYALPPAATHVVDALSATLHAVIAEATGGSADDELDEELAETFPASDPLPWSHRSD